MNETDMRTHKTEVAQNTFLLSILETLKINGVIEYFRYMSILQNTTMNAILVIPTMVFTEK